MKSIKNSLAETQIKAKYPNFYKVFCGLGEIYNVYYKDSTLSQEIAETHYSSVKTPKGSYQTETMVKLNFKIN